MAAVRPPARVLVTGGAGFIGSHLVERLLATGHRVTVVDDGSAGHRFHPGTDRHRLDIGSPELAAVFAASAPEAVFHLAAQASVARSLQDPGHDAEVNIRGTLHVLQQAIAHRVRVFVYASTGGAIYGDPATLPAAESLPPRPTSPYGVSKLAAEAYVAALCSPAGIRFLCLRYGNVYGPRQDPAGEAGVIARFTDRMLHDRPAVIFGDGRQERDFVFVSDVVEANLLALGAGGAGICNIGSGVGVSVRQIHAALAAELGQRQPPEFAPVRVGEVARIRLDCRLARTMLGWQPRIPLAEGIRRTIAWHRSGAGGGEPATR